MEEIDVWRTASLLINAHGEDAWLQAAMRADKALEDGNMDGESLWKRIGKAIDELQRKKPEGTTH